MDKRGERTKLRTRSFDFVYLLAAEYGRWNGEDFYEILWATNAMGMKHMAFSKAARDLRHDPKITSEEGIRRTVEWLKSIYHSEV